MTCPLIVYDRLNSKLNAGCPVIKHYFILNYMRQYKC
jgi:hypothetical protein